MGTLYRSWFKQQIIKQISTYTSHYIYEIIGNLDSDYIFDGVMKIMLIFYSVIMVLGEPYLLEI